MTVSNIGDSYRINVATLLWNLSAPAAPLTSKN
jgi:hypothetical protein